MNYITFLKDKPNVVQDYVGYPPINWKWFWNGYFGQGFYRLTKANRRNPKHEFKTIDQVWREINTKRIAIVQPKVIK
jgi:hypothetical protein